MKKVAVFGMGKSGVAAANFLARRGVAVVATDSAPSERLPLVSSLDPRVEQRLGGHPPGVLDGVDLVVLSPGIPATIGPLREAGQRGIPVISEIELAFRHLRGPVVAITGSNGKSTTTALIGEILRLAGRDPIVAGNIGDPLIAAVAEEERYYVIELSSFQLETVDSFRANVALLLNITPDHLDRYPSIEEYARAKYRIFRNQTAEDVAVVNADDRRTASPHTPARLMPFSSARSLAEGAFVRQGQLALRRHGEETWIPRSALRLEGNANVENALAAWAAADACGVGVDAVRAGFESFRGLPHRMVLVRELAGVKWINDSKGTNVDASLKSLEGMEDGRVVLILGGKDKKGEFERMRDLVRAKAKAVLTIGAAAPRVAEALEGYAPIVPCETMARAVAWGRENASRGDVVLLSPACASFDQYDNFEHRGRDFEALVGALEESR